MIKEFEKRLLSSIILIPIAIFFIIKGSVFFIFFLSILFLATSYEWIRMSKKKLCLVCPSCKVFEINLINNKFFCSDCNLYHNIKNDYPILINFNLMNMGLDSVINYQDINSNYKLKNVSNFPADNSIILIIAETSFLT